MNKIKRVLIRKEIGGKIMESVYDHYMNATKKMMFRLVFALARALKIKPKALAASFTLEDVDKYATELNSELLARANKETEKIKKAFSKAKKG